MNIRGRRLREKLQRDSGFLFQVNRGWLWERVPGTSCEPASEANGTHSLSPCICLLQTHLSLIQSTVGKHAAFCHIQIWYMKRQQRRLLFWGDGGKKDAEVQLLWQRGLNFAMAMVCIRKQIGQKKEHREGSFLGELAHRDRGFILNGMEITTVAQRGRIPQLLLVTNGN